MSGPTKVSGPTQQLFNRSQRRTGPLSSKVCAGVRGPHMAVAATMAGPVAMRPCAHKVSFNTSASSRRQPLQPKEGSGLRRCTFKEWTHSSTCRDG